MTRLKTSWKKHPILWNLFMIFIAFLIVGYLALCFFDIWTHHGSTTRVPEVKGMDCVSATRVLKDADLQVVIVDSIYNKNYAPGSVVDVNPQSGAVVKKGREVYLTIVAFSPEPIIIDRLLTDISWKQAEAYLKSKGLRVEKEMVTSQYPDLVVDVKCKGRSLAVGSQVTVNDVIVLEVGQVPEVDYEAIDDLDLMIEAAIAADSIGGYSTPVENDPQDEEAETTLSPEQHVRNTFAK
ncbi:MAG: PASTA domain-containing protein [Muribaculaceae bacterium]|nr:PASTA domain-containing protein [Muribaculaceae bacterium]